MNLRPSGYEPDELPDCSTPRQPWGRGYRTGVCPLSTGECRLPDCSDETAQRMTPEVRSAEISASATPASSKISELCSPW